MKNSLGRLLSELREACGIREVAQALLPHARRLGFCRFRLYHYSGSEGKLVSVEAAGHEPDLESKFREGMIVKPLSAHDHERDDSFQCLIAEEALVVKIE